MKHSTTKKNRATKYDAPESTTKESTAHPERGKTIKNTKPRTRQRITHASDRLSTSRRQLDIRAAIHAPFLSLACRLRSSRLAMSLRSVIDCPFKSCIHPTRGVRIEAVKSVEVGGDEQKYHFCCRQLDARDAPENLLRFGSVRGFTVDVSSG